MKGVCPHCDAPARAGSRCPRCGEPLPTGEGRQPTDRPRFAAEAPSPPGRLGPGGHTPSRVGTGFVDPTSRARLAQLCVGLVCLTALVGLWSSQLQIDLLERVETAPKSVSMGELEANDGREGAVALFYLGALVLAMIFFLRWFSLCYRNLQINGRQLKHGTGWAIGAWFVPILNLFRPYQISREIWQKSVDDGASHGLLGLWWVLWLASGISEQMASRKAADTVKSLLEATELAQIAGGLTFGAGLACIAVIEVLSKRNRASTLTGVAEVFD